MTDIQFAVGDGVQLRNGLEAEVLDVVPGQRFCILVKVRNKSGEWCVSRRLADGRAFQNGENPGDLIHKPKRLSGFVNVYRDSTSDVFETREGADGEATSLARYHDIHRIDCIDLSERTEGQGL